MSKTTKHRRRWYQCYTSESYFATALSLHGREDETDCLGRLISADWSRKGAHPKTYAPEDVTIDLCAADGPLSLF